MRNKKFSLVLIFMISLSLVANNGKTTNIKKDFPIVNNSLTDTTIVDSITIKDSLDAIADTTIVDSTAVKDSLESQESINLKKRKEIFKDAIEMIKTNNVYEVLSWIISKTEGIMAVNVFGDLQNYYYWKNKDIETSLVFGNFGIAYSLTKFKENELFNPELSLKFKKEAANISFDVASFCWDGWDEKNIKINETIKYFGFQAAKTDIKLVKEMDLGDINLARSHWILAGQYLSIKEYKKAIAHYNRSAYLAKRGGSISEALLAKSFETISKLLLDGNSSELLNEYKFYLENLKKQEDGKFFASEVETAFKFYKGN